MEVEAVKLEEFRGLFNEFVPAYLQTDEGMTHLGTYGKLRDAAHSNWEVIDAAESRGELDPDQVLLKLLPWADTAANREKGAWTHIAPAIAGDVKMLFERRRPMLIAAEDWPRVASEIVRFVRSCVRSPDNLEEACRQFDAVPYIKGIQAGYLSPIISALKPESYLLINAKSQATINHFANTSFSARISRYPELNQAGLDLLDQLRPIITAVITDDRVLVTDVFDQFCHWLVALKEFEFGRLGYWKIAPGDGARFWDEWRDEGCVSIGWSELGDLSGVSYEEFARRRDEVAQQHPDWTKEAVEQVWTFANIREVDRIVANRGTREVLGIGTVSGPYYFLPGAEYGHRLPVTWDDLTVRSVDKGGWRRTLVKLSRSDFREVASGEVQPPEVQSISKQTFDLLGRLSEDPTAAFYQAHREEFERHVEKPIRALMAGLARQLTPDMQSLLETQKGLYSRILKNDFGQGGAWPWSWAAFYPKGAKRISAPQLFVSLLGSGVRFGFGLGEYASEFGSHLKRGLAENRQFLVTGLGPQLEQLGVQLTDGRATADGETPVASVPFSGWLKDPPADYLIAAELSPEQVDEIGASALEAKIAQAFAVLGPMMRMAMDLPPEVEEHGNPSYSLDDLVRDTSTDRDTIEGWLRAIERKGQAILYGPPGTGKTYIAGLIADHLIAETDGFRDLVQFHPSYSYEDFMEGIRPGTIDGHLTYDLQRGRFLQFCDRARALQGKCVLIVDEINRANLSRVFGELMYLLEYRKKEIRLASGTRFEVPENVRVIGTMNTADRSIALVDHALRRRFGFLELRPNPEVLRKYHADPGFDVERLIKLLQRVNTAIKDPHYEVGITYFLDQNIRLNLRDIWETEILPYLEELFFDRPADIEQFRWAGVKGELGL